MTWKSEIRQAMRTALGDVEAFADTAWRRFAHRMGFDRPQHIAAYRGYGNAYEVWVRGRLLANKPYGGPREDDTWWDNLQASYQRWNSNEVTGAEIDLTFGTLTRRVITDEEGYYTATFPIEKSSASAHAIHAAHEAEDGRLTATHKLALPGNDVGYVLISDVDDTVIHTRITDLIVAAQLTFLNNAKTRKPLLGAAALYQELARGPNGQSTNPVIYLSNSAWNMYDLLCDFLDLNDFPFGPLLLRDLGIGSETTDHKPQTLRRLFKQFAPFPVVLIGDSGQHDADYYARIAAEYPDRVRAIFIRDIEAQQDSAFDTKVDDIIAQTAYLGVPFFRIADSAEIARHAAKLGLLRSDAISHITSEVDADAHRLQATS